MNFEEVETGMCLINLRGQMKILVVDGVIESEELGHLLDVTVYDMRYDKFELRIGDGIILSKKTFEGSDFASSAYSLSEKTGSDFKKNFISHLMKCSEVDYV